MHLPEDILCLELYVILFAVHLGEGNEEQLLEGVGSLVGGLPHFHGHPTVLHVSNEGTVGDTNTCIVGYILAQCLASVDAYSRFVDVLLLILLNKTTGSTLKVLLGCLAPPFKLVAKFAKVLT